MDYTNINTELFKYCPKCGAAAFRWVKPNKLICDTCGFEFYHNNAVAVAAIIKDKNDKLLLIERACEPAKGMLDLPGGFADHGESCEQTLKREIKEELGLNITSASYLCSAPNNYKYKSVTYSTVDIAFSCKVDDISKAKPADDAKAIVFVGLDEIEYGKLAFESTRKIIEFYLTCL